MCYNVLTFVNEENIFVVYNVCILTIVFFQKARHRQAEMIQIVYIKHLDPHNFVYLLFLFFVFAKPLNIQQMDAYLCNSNSQTP